MKRENQFYWFIYDKNNSLIDSGEASSVVGAMDEIADHGWQHALAMVEDIKKLSSNPKKDKYFTRQANDEFHTWKFEIKDPQWKVVRKGNCINPAQLEARRERQKAFSALEKRIGYEQALKEIDAELERRRQQQRFAARRARRRLS